MRTQADYGDETVSLEALNGRREAIEDFVRELGR